MSEVSGVLVLDKPMDMTSHDAVNIMRRLYNTKKVGHTGTLDPMATGVLVILIGRAAKAAEYLVSDNKGYRAGLALGVTYDTGDTTGTLLSESGNVPLCEECEKAIASFIGKGRQIPPMYSALKVDGRKLVDLARKGIEVERKPRDIEIYNISSEYVDQRNYFINVECSKGTYIRTLCEDIGAKLGCGGAMSSLRRTRSGEFDLGCAHTIAELEEMSLEERQALLMPIESLFSDLEEVVLPEFFTRLARSGQEIYLKKISRNIELGKKVRLCDKNGFFALGEVREFEEGNAIKPIKQFVL